MSIRARLTIAVVVLVVASTGLIGWLVIGAAQTSMVDRLDERLLEANTRPLRDILNDNDGEGLPGQPPPNRPPGNGVGGPNDLRSIAEVIISRDGVVLLSLPTGFDDDPDPLPEIPTDPQALNRLVGRIVEVSGHKGEGSYRMLTESAGPNNSAIRILAISMEDVEQTIARLRQIVVLLILAVAAAGAAVASFVVRQGLRPVDQMIATAGQIGAGDLSSRVDHPDNNTELGRLGNALDNMLNQLEKAFAERTASEDRLKRFATDASHELRTPVTAIRGYAELYRQGGLREQADLDRAMSRIEGESTRMGRLVEDLLLLARLDQQRPLAAEPVSLQALLTDAVDDHLAIAPDHPVDVASVERVEVIGDEPGLRQVFTNLLANVRTHTPAGTTTTMTLREADGWATMTITDDGPGIPTGDLPRVFERFHRADPSRTRATGGSGLGLAIVAALVQAHHGTLSVGAGPNDVGTSFTLALPSTPPPKDEPAMNALRAPE